MDSMQNFYPSDGLYMSGIEDLAQIVRINKIKNDMKGARGTMKNRFQNLFSPKTGRDNDHPSHQDDDAAAVTQRRPSTGDKGTVIAGGGSLISPSALLSLKSIAAWEDNAA